MGNRGPNCPGPSAVLLFPAPVVALWRVRNLCFFGIEPTGNRHCRIE